MRDLLPWRDFIIETSWPPTVAAIEIKKRIATRRLFGRGDEPFVGLAATDTDFLFSRTTAYRNSFVPVIHARVEPSLRDGARVRVHMWLYYGMAVVMILWMSGAMWGAEAGLVSVVRGRAVGLVGLAMPAFVLVLTVLPFALEARKAEALLRGIFAAAPGLPPPMETGEPYR